MMDFRKECLYDVEWQKLRVQLLAVNNNYGGFGSEKGVRINLEKLNDYAYAALVGDEMNIRFWRVQNLLSATLLGYGGRRDICYTLVKEAHTYYSTLYHKIWVKRTLDNGVWDWDKVRRDLQDLYNSGDIEWKWIWDNLMIRVATANRKQKKGKGGMQHRVELAKFLKLMAEIDPELEMASL